MYTKTPDYIISDCGRPHWSNDCGCYYAAGDFYQADKAFAKVLTGKSGDPKLLPLRETLTEYYKRLLTEQADLMRGSGPDSCGSLDSAQRKQHKNQRNETIKQRQQRPQQSQQQRSLRNQPRTSRNRNSRDKSSWSRVGKGMAVADSDLNVF